jgi:glycosyltransferase involved in cell wall biosynthesis
VDLFVAVSPSVARFLVDDLGAAPAQVVVRPNSLPDPGPTVAPSIDGFVFVGRLEEIKGLSLLADAWRQQAPAGWHLTIAGDGPDRSVAERLAASRDDVTYAGPVDAATVRELMDANRVVLVPSVWYEAMPMVVVEAFSRGRPVLGTGHGALADLIDPTVGWLCDPTVASLGAALRRAAATPLPDPAAPRRRYEEQYRGDEAAGWLLDQYDRVRARTARG